MNLDTECFSMNSLMSKRISARSEPKRYSASVRATSVLPTPVGPRNKNDPTGRLGFFNPARERRMARAKADIAGRWMATVKYDWGDVHDEVFEFKYLGQAIHGTASYLTGRLTIEQASLDGEWLRFTTRSHEMLGSDSPRKEVVHRYTGRITADSILFTLESGGGYSIHPPVEFVARRAKP